MRYQVIAGRAQPLSHMFSTWLTMFKSIPKEIETKRNPVLFKVWPQEGFKRYIYLLLIC